MKSGTTELMKFKRLQRAIGESVRGTVGLLELLWTATAKNCPEGDVGRFTDEEIAIMCDWDGDPETLVSALVSCGWLDECETFRLIVHDWAEHCPQFVKGFMSKHDRTFAKQATKQPAKQPAKQRAKQRAIAGCHSTLPPSLAKPSLTKSNQVKSSQDSCSEAQSRSEPDSVAVVEADEIVEEFPVVGTKGSSWGMPRSLLEELQRAYPPLDVPAEARLARAWLVSNPTKRKTPNGMPRFLNAWMTRANDRLRGSPVGAKPTGHDAIDRFLEAT